MRVFFHTVLIWWTFNVFIKWIRYLLPLLKAQSKVGWGMLTGASPSSFRLFSAGNLKLMSPWCKAPTAPQRAMITDWEALLEKDAFWEGLRAALISAELAKFQLLEQLICYLCTATGTSKSLGSIHKTLISNPLQFHVSLQRSVLGCSELPTEVLGGCIVQPVGIHHTQVPHVALIGVQEFIVRDTGWLAMEKDRGGVDGHRLMGVSRGVAAIRLQLGCVHEKAIGEAAANISSVRSGGL